MNICFNVLHQRLIRGDSVPLIEGSKDYIHCTFTFSEDWTALGKAALFSLQGDSKTYVAVIDNISCKIPDAVCQSGGRCEMALIGAGYDMIDALSSGSTEELKSADVIITTNRCELRFGETVTVNTVNEDESEENPFADVLAKITALSDSYESKQNKTDDALTTEDKTVVGAINEINSNKQAKDFVITGTVTGDLGTGNVDVSDISCTYEEARAAFDGGRNVKCLFYVPELSTYTEFRYKAHSEYAIMFECMFRDYNYLPVFMADGTWDWSFYKGYADKVFCNDIAGYAGFYLYTEFLEETGNRNLTDAIVENRHRIETLETDSIKTLILTNKYEDSEILIPTDTYTLNQTYEEVYNAVQNKYRILYNHGKNYYSATQIYVYEDTENEDAAYIDVKFHMYGSVYTATFFRDTTYGVPTLTKRNMISDNLETANRDYILSANQGRVLNEKIMALEEHDYIVECEITISDNDELIISNTSAGFDDIVKAVTTGKNVVLKSFITGRCVIASNLIESSAYEFVFLYDSMQFTVICDSTMGWYGYGVPVASKNEVSDLYTQIGDINTALETALNGGAS